MMDDLLQQLEGRAQFCADRGEEKTPGLLRRAVGRIAELEAALWVALSGREIVVREDTPRAIEWVTTEDGGRMVRRANQQ